MKVLPFKKTETESNINDLDKALNLTEASHQKLDDIESKLNSLPENQDVSEYVSELKAIGVSLDRISKKLSVPEKYKKIA